TIAKEASCETVIKKSRFIGAVYPVETPEEAQDRLAQIKKKYWDARHNCSAMILGEDASAMRYSDDGEPQGTAGIPMLEVLKQKGVTNILAVVTRYFGGVLLGAGGLARAYSGSVSDALRVAGIVKMEPCFVFSVKLPYASFGKLEAMAANSVWGRGETIFAENVQVELYVPMDEAQKFEAELKEAFLGCVQPERQGNIYISR
ncbi:MAG: YigZ family protein, partial [Eubacteriales bacterium]